MTSVRVSWAGLLETSVCADFIKVLLRPLMFWLLLFINYIDSLSPPPPQVKHWRGMDINDWHMSDKLTVDTTSFIVMNLVPNIPFYFQVHIYTRLRTFDINNVSIEYKISLLLWHTLIR